ncbi:hypothetical protein ACLMAL_36555 (plasmid) [Nocardia sp. CWNU-33]|uniref:hypothetical protein n=1 Tax=Nocardia sp. CWNU-33 TaxID=3392117 RepID=UPI00398EC2E2
MTTDIQEWERQLQRELAEIRSSSKRLADEVAVVRGRGEVPGVLVEVDADGDITDLRIAPGAMRWPGHQLTTALLNCHRKARADAKASAERLLSKADPRIHDQFQRLHSEQTPEDQRPSEDEIQAADDAYFERMNQRGWNG